MYAPVLGVVVVVAHSTVLLVMITVPATFTAFPTLTFPLMPTPPDTTKAPVVVVLDAVVPLPT